MNVPPWLVFVEDVRRFRDADALVVRLPAGLRSRRKLFAALARGLGLPAYFGGNWDALEECLRDFGWLPGVRRVALVHETLPLRANRSARSVYLDILRSAAEFASEHGPPQFVAVFPVSTRQAVIEALPAR